MYISERDYIPIPDLFRLSLAYRQMKVPSRESEKTRKIPKLTDTKNKQIIMKERRTIRDARRQTNAGNIFTL